MNYDHTEGAWSQRIAQNKYILAEMWHFAPWRPGIKQQCFIIPESDISTFISTCISTCMYIRLLHMYFHMYFQYILRMYTSVSTGV